MEELQKNEYKSDKNNVLGKGLSELYIKDIILIKMEIKKKWHLKKYPKRF